MLVNIRGMRSKKRSHIPGVVVGGVNVGNVIGPLVVVVGLGAGVVVTVVVVAGGLVVVVIVALVVVDVVVVGAGASVVVSGGAPVVTGVDS